ncbi:TPA: AAA family ATPase [Klebsiella variicola]|nr:AAA family ATPase [Klebsiella variicola]
MKITIDSAYKSIPKGVTFDLPDFCVITGINGTGKSHLLEAIADEKISTVLDDGKPLKKIHIIGFGGLTSTIDDTYSAENVLQSTKYWWERIQSLQWQMKGDASQFDSSTDPTEIVLKNVDHELRLTIRHVMKKTSKRLDELNEEDVYYNSDFLIGNSNGSFYMQMAFAFKMYQMRKVNNDFKAFLNAKNKTSLPVLTDEEFLERYGPEPWVMINKMLESANIDYEVVIPDGGLMNSTYKFNLIDKSKGTVISVNELSTGEKVIISLASVIYNPIESLGKPDLLVFDEPDAPLHPYYSKMLIDTLTEFVVKKSGVRVILTTHSPSTVSVCPDNSLFEMSLEDRTPKMISTNRAIEVLTCGIPYLRVILDGRLQVFVESKYDVIFFNQLFQITSKFISLPYHPIFLEPNSHSSNCSDVIKIATTLSKYGSDMVRGVIDWDGENEGCHPIYILGGGQRYAIENYILDPIFIAIALLRSEKKKYSDFCLGNMSTYFDMLSLNVIDVQRMADTVLSLTGIEIKNTKECKLMNGWVVHLPEKFLHMRGHSWEALLLERIGELNSLFSKGGGDAQFKLAILKVINEMPHLLSADIKETFYNIK